MIKIGGQPLLYRNWCTAGIYFIDDLLDNNRFMSLEIFNEKYNIDVNFVEYYGIVNAIPRDWKLILREHNEHIVMINNTYIDIY